MSKAKYVDPIIGTVGDEKAVAKCVHGGGKTHPGACVPSGMVQFSPDTITKGDNGTGYNYCNDTIEGFSVNHMSGIGWYGDMGNLQIMPVVGETDLRSGSNAEVPFTKGTQGWKSHFDHENEKARAGYYSVFLDRYGILAETTASSHCGMMRITYPEKCDARVILNFSRRIAGHADFEYVEFVSKKRLEGVIKCSPEGGGFGRGKGGIKYNLNFVLEFDKTPKKAVFFSNEEYQKEGLNSFEGKDVGLCIHFQDDLCEPVTIKVAISYVDIEGAKKNFDGECTQFDFDKTASEAFEAWEKVFDGVSVEGSNSTDLSIFYTCLYHALLDPRISADVDGRFVLGDGSIHKEEYTHRTMFSGWDVYRSEFPLLTLIRPDIVNDEVNSLLKIALNRNSALPRWELVSVDSGCMVGDPGLLVSVDAYLKGIRGFDVEKLYEVCNAACRKYKELFGRPFIDTRPPCNQMLTDAFCPQKLSITLEYLLCDYAMAKLSRELGKNEQAEYHETRARKYVENYNPTFGFMCPRNEDGSFMNVKDEYDETGCVESNIFQQSWFVPYDVKGLSNLFGKERTFLLLEKLFGEADLSALWNVNYNHSNEPCHNITHYFAMLGKPHRTQYWTRRVQKEAYRTGAFGFCGNEDVGQLSAWYVLSAMGFAQVCIADERYWINTPLFKKAEIKLSEKYHSRTLGDTFRIECDKDPENYPYISQMYFNGQKLDRYYLDFSEITRGGVLEIKLCDKPCTEVNIIK